jgi:5-methylthioadenosine/S-adenosylhomocysteine deaminase
VTVDAERRIITDGAVAVDQGEIVAVGKRSQLEAEFDPKERVGDDDALLIPGLINAHQHLTGDGLMRSAIPDQVSTQSAIFDWVMPVHAAHEPEDDQLTATLGLAESLLAGITTIVEAGTVAHPARVAQAFRTVGARGMIGSWGWDVEGLPFSGTYRDVIQHQAEVVSSISADNLLKGWVTLVGHNLMSDELVIAASQLAKEHGVGLTFHMSPTTSDVDSYLKRTGSRPFVHLNRLGVLGPHVLVAHAVHIDDDELSVLVSTDTAVAYCPWSYLRLGQGVTRFGRHHEMIERGVRVGLGCDAQNAGDRIDILDTARLAAGLARDMTMDTTRFGAHAAFEMTTIGGAASIGMADKLGSIEPGKRADLVVIDRSGLEWAPWSSDPVLQLVWGADGHSVRDVVVDGRVVVRDRMIVGIDHEGLVAEATKRRAHVLKRTELMPRSRWPLV